MILDTNAVSAILERDRDITNVVSTAPHWFLPSIVLGEFESGLLASNKQAKLREGLQHLLVGVQPMSVDWSTASNYAGIKHRLKLTGRPLPENDLWIAALALQHDQPILSRDAHFDVIDGVRRVGW